MKRQNQKTKSAEDILMELHSKKSLDKDTKPSKSSEDIEEQKPKRELVKSNSTELKDLTKNEANSQPLTEADYLILEQHCLGTSEDVIIEEFKVTKGYLNSLLRNSNASTFLDKYSKTLQQKVLTKNLGMIAEGMDKQHQLIQELFAKGQTQLANQMLFGKLSMVEVQEKLSKIYADEEDDNSAPIQNLFLNLQQR